MRLIAHRGFWFPHASLQNHPSALTTALQQGWDVEVDVWRTHGWSLLIGHDRPQYEWTLPAPAVGPGRVILHLKTPSTTGMTWSDELEDRLAQVIEKAGWGSRVVSFVSPVRAAYSAALPRWATVTCREGLEQVQPSSNVWVEQPEQDWVGAEDIERATDRGLALHIVSSEVHGRQVSLERAVTWRDAEGIVTDFPHLYQSILETEHPLVHPAEAWW